MDGELAPKTHHGAPCRKCGKTLRYIRANACVDCTSIRVRHWQKANKAKQYAATRRWEAKNPAANQATKARWRARNRAHQNAAKIERKAKLLQRTPKWVTPDHRAEMRAIYRFALRMRRMTGNPWHVDHIVPLRGKDVCGLHVPWNLRVIPARMNLTKGNRLVGP